MSSRKNRIAQMAASLAGNPAMENEVRAEIEHSSLVSHLISLRVAKGVTQEQIAASMHCDPSKISRLEAGNDLALRWSDIVGYLQALHVNMSIFTDDASMPAADRIKAHVFRIHAELENLCALARQVGGDDEIAKKIHQFYGEVLINFLVRYKDSFDHLSAVIKVPAAPSQPCAPGEQEPLEAAVETKPVEA